MGVGKKLLDFVNRFIDYLEDEAEREASTGTSLGRSKRKPNQIRNLGELKPGMVAIRHHQKPGEKEMHYAIKIVSEPRQSHDGSWYVEILHQNYDGGWDQYDFESKLYLSDAGVVPYEDGYWNFWNWLEKSE